MALNTEIYQEAWETKLAMRLDKPQNWKDADDVIYTDTQTTNLPYIGTAGEPAVTTLYTDTVTRDLSHIVTFLAVTESKDQLVIVSTEYDAVYVDYASQAQSNYSSWANIGDLLGKKVGEKVESLSLAQHASWTNMGDAGGGVVGLAATQLQITANNIDDVIRGIIEQINTANGFDIYNQNGGFAIWRPADWTFLVTYMQANGFQFADEALRDGGKGRMGKESLGLYHYVSTLHTANHLMAGVRGVQKLGLLRSTFGKTYITETPPSTTAGMLSGTGIHCRLDYGFKIPTNLAPVIFDFNVV